MATRSSTPRDTRKRARISVYVRILVMCIFSVFAFLFAVEMGLRYGFLNLPLRYQKYLHDDVAVLAQASKSKLLPEDYVALVGDSYAMGVGDWYTNAVELERFGNPPFHSANVIHNFTGMDVISFGVPGAGSFDGIAYYPIKQYESLRSRGYLLSPPSKIVIYFYEGNDLDDNLVFLNKYLDASKVKIGIKSVTDLFDQIFNKIHPPRDRYWIIHYMRDLRLVKNLYITKLIYALGWDVYRVFRGSGDMETETSRIATQIVVAGKTRDIRVRLQAPALELDYADIRKAVIVFESAVAYIMEYFDEAEVLIVYLPSPVSSYEISSKQVFVQTYWGNSSLYAKEDVDRRKEELRNYIGEAARRLGVGFLDLGPIVRERAKYEFLHGPRDWNHFNEVGYTVLGKAVAKKLGTLTEDEAD